MAGHCSRAAGQRAETRCAGFGVLLRRTTLTLSKKSQNDAPGRPLRLPEAWEGTARRERVRIARVDARDHRPRAVARGLLAKAPREERRDAFVLEAGGTRGDERLLQEAQLAGRREDRVEESRGPRHDGARAAAADDPARRLRIRRHDARLEAEIGEQPIGGGARAQRVRSALDDEPVLADGLYRSSGRGPGLEDDALARARPPVGRRQPRDPAAEDHDAAHAAAFVTTSASARTNAGWSFRPSATA